MTSLSQRTKQPKTQKEKSGVTFYLNVIVRVLQSLVIVGFSLFVMTGTLGLGIGLGYFAYLVGDTEPPTKQELQQELGDVTETSKLVYADDSLITTIRSDLQRTRVEPDQISELIKDAVISTEDEYFHEHNGMVPKAVIRALISEVTGIGSSGGSTLTQQLVKQQMLTSETTFRRKAVEILYAMEVEKNFSKEEIVTMYLNISPFGRNNLGENIAGVQEAAQGIFGVNADEVNLPQAAFIAGLPQNPYVYTPYTNTGEMFDEDYLQYGLERKDFVLFSMYRNHAISEEEYNEALAYDLVADFKARGTRQIDDNGFLYYAIMEEAADLVALQLAQENSVSEEDYATEEVYQEYLQKAQLKIATGGYTVHSTIDQSIHDAMQQAVADYGSVLDSSTRIEVGNVLMENSTGRILGFVGGRDYQRNQYNHAFSSKRQAGSAIKPVLVYAPALEQGLIGSETMVSDYATKWQDGVDAGKPIVNATNSGSNTFQTVRESLIYSNNIPAYHLYQNTLDQTNSQSYVYDHYLKEMNYPDLPVWQYESAPLGVAEITTLTQTNGFQTIANEGVYNEGYLVEAITDSTGNVIYQHELNPTRVFSKATASIMNDMLRDVVRSGATTNFISDLYGINWNLATNVDWVGKTGTTDAYVDSWLVVSTPTVTLSSWSGREDSLPNDFGSGQRTATYMAYLANAIHNADSEVLGVNQTFSIDSSVNNYQVSSFTGTRPGGKMTVNNVTFDAPSSTVTSYWATGGPTNVSLQFGIGGTQANYLDYWKKVVPKPRSRPRATPREEEKEEDEDKEDTDNDDNNNDDDDNTTPESSAEND